MARRKPILERVTVEYPLDSDDLTAALATYYETKPRGRPSRARVLALVHDVYEANGLQFEWSDGFSVDEADAAWDWAAAYIAKLWPT